MSGHIRRRGERSWELKFDVGRDPLTGKRRIRYHSFKGSKREAKLKLAQLIADGAKGEYVEPSKMKLSEFVERWKTDWAAHNVSPKTFERYAELLRSHVCARIGNAPLQKLQALDLNALYSGLLRDGGLKRSGLSPRTVRHVHRVIHLALGHATKWGLVRRNVAALADAVKVEDEEVKTLTPEQIQTALGKLAGRSIYPICSLALATGMRRGELLALRWCDVDLNGATLSVERSLEQTKAGLRFKAPKTKRGRRKISLPPSTVTMLRDHWKAQQELRLRLGQGRAPDDALVFPTWEGNPRSPNALTKEWTVAMNAAGLSGVTLHSLRHTHASQLITAGMDVLTISRRLGHGSPAITLGVYGHLFANTDAKAAEIMEKALTPKGSE